MADRVLVIDDDEGMIDVCVLTLRQAGFEVSSCSSGDEALKLLETESFDLVLTDLNMPGATGGAAVVRHVKSRRPQTEVIVFTGQPALRTAIETLKDGASDYITKPFSPEYLKLSARRCLDHRRAREALSSERALRLELEAAYGELQKVERLKESFVARVSHELKTPLSELLLGLGLLQENFQRAPREDGEGGRLLDLALQGARKLEKTIFDLLAFVDLQNNKGTAPRTTVDLETLCRRAAEKLQPLWEPRHLKIEIEFASEAREVQGDRDLLERAFEHLLHNAVVFNREGGSIRVDGRSKDGSVELTFSDTGEGIPESEFPMIFDGFYQIAHYLTRKVQGLGLGLATTRSIVEAHGGDIRVSSRPGEGATFTVRLPKAGPPASRASRETPPGP